MELMARPGDPAGKRQPVSWRKAVQSALPEVREGPQGLRDRPLYREVVPPQGRWSRLPQGG